MPDSVGPLRQNLSLLVFEFAHLGGHEWNFSLDRGEIWEVKIGIRKFERYGKINVGGLVVLSKGNRISFNGEHNNLDGPRDEEKYQ